MLPKLSSKALCALSRDDTGPWKDVNLFSFLLGYSLRVETGVKKRAHPKLKKNVHGIEHLTKLDMEVHTYNSSIWENETGELLQYD